MDLEAIVNDLLFRLKEQGWDAKVVYTIDSRTNEVTSFRIDILGRLE